MSAEHFQAVFVDTATTPASALRVKIPGFDNGVGTFAVTWSPLGNALPAAGDQALVVEADDGTWWAVSWESARQYGTPPTVAALPSAPANDQEVYFQTAAMAVVGVRWRLVYNAASASIYKWEFGGGGPWISAAAAGAAGFTSTTYLATGAATLTLPPLAGDYEFEVAATLQTAVAGANNVLASLFDDGVDTGLTLTDVASGQFDGATVYLTRILTGIGASSVMDLRYKTLNTLASNYSVPVIKARPVRVG